MISIIIPLFNEEESLSYFYPQLKAVVSSFKEHEIIFIDDGSKDGSLEALKKIAQKDKTVKVYSFRKNLGKSEALTFGFDKAIGDTVVTLDADLQDKPTEIKKLLLKLDDGWDMVSGWRKDRKDSRKKIISSRLFNSIAGNMWGLHLHDYNCGLKAYRSEVVKNIRLYGGLHRFIPLLAHQQGFNVTEIPIEHDIRRYGSSKYGFSKLFKDFPDMFTMIFLSRYGDRPLHFFGWFGGILLGLGLVILAYLSMLKLWGEGIGHRPLLFLGMLLVLSGFQVFFTGFLADLIINMHKQSSKDFPIKYSSS